MKTSSTSLLLSTVLLAAGLLASSPSTAAAQSWPNEPAGSTVLTDWSWNAMVGGGWDQNGGAYISQDPTAPLSPSNVMTMRYPAGSGGGGSPSIVYYILNGGNGVGELYIGYWWKPSDPWQGHQHNINKIAFTTTNANGSFIQMMYGPPGGPYRLMTSMELYNTDNSHLGNGFGDIGGTWQLFGNASGGTITLGKWHRIEVYAKRSSTPTSRDGVMKWWVDGVLVGNYVNANYPTAPWVEFQFSPTWGGGDDTKLQTDYFWYDHVRLSTGGTGGGTKSDTTPPSTPSGLRAN